MLAEIGIPCYVKSKAALLGTQAVGKTLGIGKPRIFSVGHIGLEQHLEIPDVKDKHPLAFRGQREVAYSEDVGIVQQTFPQECLLAFDGMRQSLTRKAGFVQLQTVIQQIHQLFRCGQRCLFGNHHRICRTMTGTVNIPRLYHGKQQKGEKKAYEG